MVQKKLKYEKFIKQGILDSYPTTIRRSFCLKNFIEINHSVNPWLYKRWLKNSTIDRELSELHKEMEETIIRHSNNESLEVTFVHLDPKINQYSTQEFA